MKAIHPSLLAPLDGLAPLSPARAHALSLLFTTGYVGSIYLSNLVARLATPPRGRVPDGLSGAKASLNPPSLPPVSSTDTDADFIPVPVPVPVSAAAAAAPAPLSTDPRAPKPGDRDHPVTIKRRVRAVCLATGLSLGGVWWVVRDLYGPRGSYLECLPTVLALLGLTPPHLRLGEIMGGGVFLGGLARAALPYLLAPTILLGPLYAMYLDGDLPMQAPSPPGGLRARFVRWRAEWSWIEWRNYVVGPLTEELSFRSALIAPALLARASPTQIVYGTPLWFGIAHAHHAWEVWRKSERDGAAALRAVLGCAFQLTYTTLFGWFAAYTFIRTGSVWPALASHVYCNIMGIYLPGNAVARHPHRKRSLYAAYVLGIAGFILGLRRL